MERIYRNLSKAEINQLERQTCSADDWSKVFVSQYFISEHIDHVHFSGKVYLGSFNGEFDLPGGMHKKAGLHHVTLHNVTVGDDCCIENIQNYVANYIIGDHTFINNCGMIVVDGTSSFGNGLTVSVLNETGGREVYIYNELSAQQAYIQTFYRHRPSLITRLKELTEDYARQHTSNYGVIGSHAFIMNSGYIQNVCIGDYCSIIGASRLQNGTLNSNESAPVTIGYGVICEDFIISSGSSLTDGVALERCFVGQACSLGHFFSASNSLFFSNCLGENGESCAIFAGPYTVTHHKSTLLIAGMFSFMNAGSGANQSNHMYKLGPIHQGTLERGVKTASDSYILWPACVGVFSLVMGRHVNHPDTSDMPFSYLIEQAGSSYLVPAVNLRSVGTIRDVKKWPKRDKRTDPHCLDIINYSLFNPFTVQKMFAGILRLKELRQITGENVESYLYQDMKITNSALNKGIDYYEIGITKYLGTCLIHRFDGKKIHTQEDLQACFHSDNEQGIGEWVDVSGLIVPKSAVDKLLDDIESKSVNSLSEVAEAFVDMNNQYRNYEWQWVCVHFKKFFGLDLNTITKADVIKVISRWKEAVVKLDTMLYNDAKKEFSSVSMTGFGMDGNIEDKKNDFEQVRGDFDSNPFVMDVVVHIKHKTARADELIDMLNKMN
jgi:hypothetical protein